MKISRALLALLPALVIGGCGSDDSNKEPARLSRQNVGMATPSNYEATTEDVLKAIDVQPYPGAKMVAQEKLNDKSIPPDEHRYRLTLGTPDAVAKVQAYYEKQLDAKAAPAEGGVSIFNHSAKGNDYKVVITTEGAQTKIVQTAIIYKH